MKAKDTQLIADATEVRRRAERRLGELMAEMPKAKGAAELGWNNETRGSENPTLSPPTLSEQGIDKNLAKRARKAASMDEATFEGSKGEEALSFSYQADAFHKHNLTEEKDKAILMLLGMYLKSKGCALKRCHSSDIGSGLAKSKNPCG